MKMGGIFTYILIAGVVYLAALIFMFINQRSYMYLPPGVVPDAQSLGVEGRVQTAEVKTQDGLQIKGWYLPPVEPEKKVIIYFHGNASNHADTIIDMRDYLNQGYGILSSEYRGFGGNSGKPTEQGLYDDARAFMEWITNEKGVSLSDIVLYGESLGSGVATQIATEYDVGALILEAPFTSTIDIAKRTYFFFPVDYMMFDRYENIKKISNIHMPLLIVHGDRDSIIPMKYGRRLFEQANEPKVFAKVEGADHNDLYMHGAAVHVLSFLKDLEKGEFDPVN